MSMMKSAVTWCIVLAFVASSVANKTTDVPECVANDDCENDRVCAKQRCVNPCLAVCGANTACHMTNHVAMCSCSPGYTGHPLIGCSLSLVPECVANEDCKTGMVCSKQTCVNPCPEVCGNNTVCQVSNHVAVCSCSLGYSGNPITGCSPSLIPECVANEDCKTDMVCSKQTCVNPCPAVCGNNNVCQVINHVTMCSCSPGYSGHPITGCSPSPSTPNRHKKFFISISKMEDWHGALSACLRRDSQLAAIENNEELKQIRQAIHKTDISYFWVSGSDHGQEGHFTWNSTGKAIPTPSDMWLPGQPSGDQDQHCVELWKPSDDKEYGLNDFSCHTSYNYICQYFV